MRSALSGSESAPPREYRRDRLEENREVEQDRPLLEVQEVEPDQVVEVEVRPARDLPQPGDPGEDQVALLVPFLEAVEIAQRQRSRAHERHLAAHDVRELRELVEREAAQEAPDGGQARIVADLEDRPGLLVERLE